MMHKTAAIILNRNLPQLTDELAEWIIKYHGDEVDLFVVENGSDPDKYSNYANIFFKESLGPAGGVNAALSQLLKMDYEYFWVNFNDARFKKPGFITSAVQTMKSNQDIGICIPFWKDNIWSYGSIDSLDLATFFAILSFAVSRRALEVCQANKNFRLEPLWDSANYSNHDNILAALLTLYRAQMLAVIDRRYEIYELLDVADAASPVARGFEAATWKNEKGPADMTSWYNRTWPQLSGNPKEKRRAVIREIEKLIRKRLGLAIARFAAARFLRLSGKLLIAPVKKIKNKALANLWQ